MLVYFLVVVINFSVNLDAIYLKFNYENCLSADERSIWTRNIFENDTPIIIESTRRSSHKIVSYIIGILLKERLGYHVTIHENYWDETTETINRLACDKRNCKNGKPQSHINMEVWLPPGFTSSKWVNENLIIDCGPLGPSGKTGIFFYNKGNDESKFEDWRMIYNNGILFYEFPDQNRPTLPQFQILRNCNDSTSELCGTKFGIDPDLPLHKVQLLNGIYKNWTMEQKISNSMINLYFTWHPNEVTLQYNLSRILFPDCNLSIKDSPFNFCDDSVNQLAKIVWIDIKTKAPLIYSLIDSFHLSQQDLFGFLRQININSENREEEYFKLACGWIKNYKYFWEPLTIGWNTTKYLHIVMLMPKSTNNITDDEKEALERALHMMNNDERYFGTLQFQLKLRYIYVTCNENEILQEYLESINLVSRENSNPIVGILSGLPTKCMEEVYKIINAQRKIMLSFRHEIFSILSRYLGNPILLQHMNTPYIFQAMASKEIYYALLLKITKYYEISNFIIITDNDDKSRMISILISKEKLYKFDEDQFHKFLQEKKSHIQIFIVDCFEENIFKILCIAGKLQMSLENGFVWIINGYLLNKPIPLSLSECSQYIKSISNHHFNLSPFNITEMICSDCNSDNLYRALIFLGQTVSMTLRKNPGINDFNAEILMKYIPEVESNEYFCFKKLIKHTPIRINQHSPLWKMWYFYKVNGTNISSLFDFDVKEKLEFLERLQVVVRRSKIWNLPERIVSDECWAGFLANFLKIRCINSQIVFCIFISSFILFSFVLFFVIIYCKKARNIYNPLKTAFHDLVQDLLDIDIHSSKLILNHIIGRGAFGMVYGGEALNSKGILEAVAVKTISENSDWIEKIDFFTEAKVMRKLRHPNIVKLTGVCLENENNFIFLIMELMLEGDVRNYLLSWRTKAATYTENSRESIELRTRLNNFVRDTAEGLNYMHSKFMVHRDIACRNCLISHDFRVKLGDFGLTRYLTPLSSNGHYKYQGNVNLPVRWMPPESIQSGLFSIKSDIWSFGILLFEIVTFGVCPYQDFSTNRNLDLMERIKRKQVSIVDYVPQSARDSVVHRLIKHCCSHFPKDRPDSMEQIISILKSENSCIRPYLTEDPPKFEGDKNLENISTDVLGMVIVEDELPFTSPMDVPLSSSQRYINMINRAFGIRFCNKTDFPDRSLRSCQSSMSISKNQMSEECMNSIFMKNSQNTFVGSIPSDLCDNMGIHKKPRTSTRSIGNLFKIQPKQFNIRLNILSKEFQ